MTTNALETRRNQQLQSEILNAARDILAEGGLEALSMRVVADRVGVSATAIYHYFASKQALVDRVVESGFRRIAEHLEGALTHYPVGSLERLLALGERYISFALENREHFSVIYSIGSSHPRAIDELPGGGGYPLLRQCVSEAMESGAIRKGDPDLASLYLWSVVHGLTTLKLACGADGSHQCAPGCFHAPPTDLYRAFATFIAHGLQATNAGSVEATPVAERSEE